MLEIIIENEELYDEETNSFIQVKPLILKLEHSLLSLSKWESKHEKPFLASTKMSDEEILDYVMCMLQTEGVTKEDIESVGYKVYPAVNAYINSLQSATRFGDMPKQRGPGDVITSELIYYWMVAFNIPFECETWHLNRLFSLIRICNDKNTPPRKMSRAELARRTNELNEKRKAELGTTG